MRLTPGAAHHTIKPEQRQKLAMDETLNTEMEHVAAAVARIQRQMQPGIPPPQIGIILGSGLGEVSATIVDPLVIPYDELPGFPRPGVDGHAGVLRLGTLARVPVAVLEGRHHGYEGGGFAPLRVAIRSVRQLGCSVLIITAAAGTLDPARPPGSLALITDHINLMGSDPLTGPNSAVVGPRFPSLVDAWEPALRQQLHHAAAGLGQTLGEGIYAAWHGPCFETPAEVRMMRQLGADLCGMSAVPDAIIARHCGMRVAGVVAVVNFAAGMTPGQPPCHERTLRGARDTATPLARLLQAFCAGYVANAMNPPP